MLNVGDKIRILEEGHWMAYVFKGEVFEVSHIDGDIIRVTDYWLFSMTQEGIGWEKVEGDE